MYTFREPGNGSDMMIRADGYMLHAHSIMLRTHSDVLQSLILRGIVPDFKEPLEVVEGFLDIMYNDKIDFNCPIKFMFKHSNMKKNQFRCLLQTILS